MIVGQRVARRRVEVRTSQTDLAKRCDLARGTIANIESGRQRPTLHTLFAIADALEADVHALLPTRGELERVAGASAPEVEDFIAARLQQDEADAQPHGD